MKITLLTILIYVSLVFNTQGQSINFGTYTSSGVMINQESVDKLEFNAKQAVILSGSNDVITIGLQDQEAAVFSVEANQNLDITILLDSPNLLELDPSNQLPCSLRFAYSNMGAQDVESARAQAVEIPNGFNTITIPVLRRAINAPGPPPTPEYNGYVAPQGKVYIFVYGSVGPIGPVDVGVYQGTINVTVDYSTYE